MKELQQHAGGNCFETAWRLVFDTMTDCFVCHGIVSGQGPLEGHRIRHAWVENASGDVVFDLSNSKSFIGRTAQYYNMGEVNSDDVKRYTRLDAMMNASKFEHFGPWEEHAETPTVEDERGALQRKKLHAKARAREAMQNEVAAIKRQQKQGD